MDMDDILDGKVSPGEVGIRALFDNQQLRTRVRTLETRLRAATLRCHDCHYDNPGSVHDPTFGCPACRSDLALLDGTPEPTR